MTSSRLKGANLTIIFDNSDYLLALVKLLSARGKYQSQR